MGSKDRPHRMTWLRERLVETMTGSDLEGRRIAIVGGSAGIGLAVARAALDQGAQVMVGSHNPQRLDYALAILGDGAAGHAIDVSDQASIEAFFETCGPVDHLVYTSGDWARRKATLGKGFDIQDAKAAFEVRLWGLLRTLEAALPRLSCDGSIVLTGGLLAHRPQKGQAISSAVTGAVEHLARALAVDLAPIRVNIVVPGFVATDVWSRMPDEAKARLVAGQPIERPGRADEVAEVYIGFMRATYTTGQSAIVDGGMSLA